MSTAPSFVYDRLTIPIKWKLFSNEQEHEAGRKNTERLKKTSSEMRHGTKSTGILQRNPGLVTKTKKF